jgi:predicted amidohydrolase
VLLYVANWPQKRSLAWKTLLPARAIENQCYVVGVNRVGVDGKGFAYSGDSGAYDPLGGMLWGHADDEAIQTVVLSAKLLEETRGHLPFLRDADRFVLPD